MIQLAIRPTKLTYSGHEIEMQLVGHAVLTLLCSIEGSELKVGLAPQNTNLRYLQRCLDKLQGGDGDESYM